MNIRFNYVLIFFLLALPFLVHAQTRTSYVKRNRILFIFDASGSMKENWGTSPKMQTAKKLMIQMMDSLRSDPNVEVALRVFGHQSPRDSMDCKDSKLEIPFTKNFYEPITEFIKTLEPKGYTPIAYSLAQATADFSKNTQARNIIVLVTDGVENCFGEPCIASEKLQKEGIIFRPYILGLGLNEESIKKFECVGNVIIS